MGSILDIYIDQDCPGCTQAQEMASYVKSKLPEIEVRIFDLARPNIKRPSNVFAVPTYLLNGKRLSLGNPNLEDLLATLGDSL